MDISVIFNLFMSYIHFVFAYSIFMAILVSNDLRILMAILILMAMVKISFFLFGRCVITLFEYNDHFATTARLMSSTLTTSISDKKGEEILINIGMLSVLNKILFLMIYRYYYSKKMVTIPL